MSAPEICKGKEVIDVAVASERLNRCETMANTQPGECCNDAICGQNPVRLEHRLC